MKKMHIHVSYNETDLYNVINSFVKHPNKQMVDLLTEIISNDSKGCDYIFKLNAGASLPQIHSIGTIVKFEAKKLYYSDEFKSLTDDNLIDADGYCTGIVHEYGGLTSWRPYKIKVGDHMFGLNIEDVFAVEEF
jgi:hypothetical protein